MRFARGILVLIAIVGLSGQLYATERHVPGEYPTIQAAVDACDDGDIVVLADGTYSGPGNTDCEVPLVTITIRSASGPAACTIDGAGSALNFRIGASGVSHVLEGITFRNYGTSLAPQEAVSATYAVIQDCRFVNNEAIRGGGVNCTSTTISECTFEGNTAHEQGGALHAYSSDIYACTFEGNTAPTGGAAWVHQSNISQSTFTDNSATVSCGALDADEATVSACSFVSNSAPNFGALCGYRVDVTDCTLTDNIATEFGKGQGGAATVSEGYFRGCRFLRNNGWDGGAVWTGVDSSIYGCRFEDNQSLGRGGALLLKGPGDVVNSIFTGNTAEYYGGAVYYRGDTPHTFAHCLVIANVSAGGGGGIYGAIGTGGIYNSIIRNNNALWGHNVMLDRGMIMILSHSNIGQEENDVYWTGGAFPAWGDGVIDVAPGFVDAATGDYRLTPSSPCIDAGDNASIPLDLDDLDGDGNVEESMPFDIADSFRIARGTVDMGAYELPFGDQNCDKAFNNGDIDPFVLAITDPASYGGEYPECVHEYADMNADGFVNNGDIDTFVALLGG